MARTGANRTDRKKQTNIFISHSSLDWYKLTENTRHVLNVAITSASKARLNEMEKEQPNQDRIDRLRTISRRATQLTRDVKVFESKDRMQQVMEEYMTIDLD